MNVQKSQKNGVVKVAQLRTPPTLAEDSGLVSSFHIDSLKLPVTPVAEDKTPSYGLHEYQAGTWYRYIHQANIHIHIHTQ